MIPHGFGYHAPTSLGEAVEILGDDPAGSVLLGGGTWVVPGLNSAELRARHVVDLRRAALDGISHQDGRIRLGATATYAALLRSAVIRREVPLLCLVAEAVTGGPQIHHQGTVGGSACAARPASDLPAALMTLDARAVVHGPGGRREVGMRELWSGPFRTSLRRDEILAGFEIPASTGGVGYVKLKRGTSSWPIVTAAAILTITPESTVDQLRVAVGAAGAVPFRVPLDDLAGAAPDAALADEAADRAVRELGEPWSDELAPAWYRARVLPAAVRRAVTAAIGHDHLEAVHG
jgi:carbon-monoxide dehydrogenase medium subunit